MRGDHHKRPFRGSVLESNLDCAICLLALISSRPTGDDEISELLQPKSAQVKSSALPVIADFNDTEHDPHVLDEVDDLENVKGDRSAREYEDHLRSRLLDCLAETLARFKSDPRSKGNLDAKHVCATMMSVDQEAARTKIFCAKNEGLDKADKKFLKKWTEWMQRVASAGMLCGSDLHPLTSCSIRRGFRAR